MDNIIIKKPIISEKTFALASENVYTFLISDRANKKTVATEVHTIYKVDVVGVRIINIPGKIKRVGRKFGKRNDLKKALVKIRKGQKISIFEEDSAEKEKKVAKEPVKNKEKKTE